VKLVHLFGFITKNAAQFRHGPARQLSTNLYDVYHCWVYSE